MLKMIEYRIFGLIFGKIANECGPPGSNLFRENSPRDVYYRRIKVQTNTNFIAEDFSIFASKKDTKEWLPTEGNESSGVWIFRRHLMSDGILSSLLCEAHFSKRFLIGKKMSRDVATLSWPTQSNFTFEVEPK
ncbi:Hypothetical protein NTJ_10914 [Nesidiocoris tenuis]|uniref:Uncharacterized protein n=1 Tax=Nesidiocoris tenuis TaxID=355587 RepID=A0ABN7B3B8_9HEMI|nr:Hypothetical protein NTJ_10914 [Nesidiocoris tenuis]